MLRSQQKLSTGARQHPVPQRLPQTRKAWIPFCLPSQDSGTNRLGNGLAGYCRLRWGAAQSRDYWKGNQDFVNIYKCICTWCVHSAFKMGVYLFEEQHFDMAVSHIRHAQQKRDTCLYTCILTSLYMSMYTCLQMYRGRERGREGQAYVYAYM